MTHSLSLEVVTYTIRIFPPTLAFSILQIPLTMNMGYLKKEREKGAIRGVDKGITEGIGKQSKEQTQEEVVGSKDGRAQDGPEPFRSREKNQCNPIKDKKYPFFWSTCTHLQPH